MQKLVKILVILFIAGCVLGIIGLIRAGSRSHIPANETSAFDNIQEIGAVEIIYAVDHPDVGFSPDLASLANTDHGRVPQAIDDELASGHKGGYTFTYIPGPKVNGEIRSYTIAAAPDQMGKTGQRRFFSDESGEVRANGSGPADASSPVIHRVDLSPRH